MPGAGEWRYPWADGGRRGIGNESRVRFPMQLLWFGGPGPGRLFLVDGTSKADLVRARRRNQPLKAELSLVALDLADGTELWRQDDVPVLGDRGQLS